MTSFPLPIVDVYIVQIKGFIRIIIFVFIYTGDHHLVVTNTKTVYPRSPISVLTRRQQTATLLRSGAKPHKFRVFVLPYFLDIMEVKVVS